MVMVIVLYLVLLVTAGVAAPRTPPARRVPVATAALFAVIAVVTLLQLTVAPGLFEALRRDRAAIGDGQVWRLVSSALVQDSGWSGAVFNLVALAVLGTFAERLWGTTRWIALVVTVQVLGGLWALYAQPVGAGTSLIDFGLGASLAAAGLLLGPAWRRAVAAVSLLAGLALLLLSDVHGGPALVGAAAGVLLTRRLRPSA
ncbi:rhomboid family intramembrane serine protease [Dactylosporangium sp. CS-047395]|uniref:rhomboid family intramembrane serine protease n=1 Tax=Dactylosporangium sp. CS-047395 TaxID=3239936 RepID=UPI003D8F3BA7